MQACDRCRGLRKRCDCRDGIYPCSRCVNNGAECTHLHSKKTKSRQKASHVHVLPAATKRKRERGETSVAQTFWSAMADTWILASLVRLGPTHWGLRNIMYGLMSRAYLKGSSFLLQRVTTLVQSIGVNLGQVTGPLSHEVQHTLSTTFEGFNTQILEAHDRAVGNEPRQRTPENTATRLVTASRALNTGKGYATITRPFRQVLGLDEAFIDTLRTSPAPLLNILEKSFQQEDIKRVLHASMYLIEQYATKTSGPLSAKVPGVSLGSGQIFDLYLTFWGEEMGHFQQYYELIPVGNSQSNREPEEEAISIDDVPEESLSAAHALTNLMKR